MEVVSYLVNLGSVNNFATIYIYLKISEAIAIQLFLFVVQYI
jgi:hypothetical protein